MTRYAIALLLTLSCAACAAPSVDLTIAWDPPTHDVDGVLVPGNVSREHRVYDIAPTVPELVATVRNQTNATITVKTGEHKYIVTTTFVYDDTHTISIESEPSNVWTQRVVKPNPAMIWKVK